MNAAIPILLLGLSPADVPTDAEVRAAVERALPPIAAGAEGYTKHRDCFSCHNQAMPLVALATARERGFAVDGDLIRAQMEHTEADLAGNRENYQKGQGQPGGTTRAGYAL